MLLRIGNIIGSEGSVFPIFGQQIQNGGLITITHPEMKRYFITLPETIRVTLKTRNFGYNVNW